MNDNYEDHLAQKCKEITSIGNTLPIIHAKSTKYYRNSITTSLGTSIAKDLISEKGAEIYESVNSWALTTWQNLKIRQNAQDEFLLNFELTGNNNSEITVLLAYLTSSFPQIRSIYLNEQHVYGDKYLKLSIDDITISVYPNNFCQINTAMISDIYRTIVSFCLLYPRKNIMSLGDDSGNVCCYLASRFSTTNIVGVLHSSASYQAALTNLTLNALTPSFVFNPSYWSTLSDKEDTLLIINPGRKGLRAAGIAALNNLKNIDTVIYMSCKISTLKLDLAQLINFKPILIQPIDNFPFIPDYCENIVLLRSAVQGTHLWGVPLPPLLLDIK